MVISGLFYDMTLYQYLDYTAVGSIMNDELEGIWWKDAVMA
jgi:hypothetical protein